MEPRLLAEYRRLRTGDNRPTAKEALGWARVNLALRDLPGLDQDWQVGPFTLRATATPEECPDLSWLGAWSDTWQDGCIRSGLYTRYFRPGNPIEETARYYVDHEGYRPGRARQVATEQARQDMRLLATYGDDWYEAVVCVTVSKAGVELASAYLGGVGLHGDQDNDAYIKGVVHDELAPEALDSARTRLVSLCGPCADVGDPYAMYAAYRQYEATGDERLRSVM